MSDVCSTPVLMYKINQLENEKTAMRAENEELGQIVISQGEILRKIVNIINDVPLHQIGLSTHDVVEQVIALKRSRKPNVVLPKFYGYGDNATFNCNDITKALDDADVSYCSVI